MKDKIIFFVMGVLVGAIIATGVFYIYTTTNNKNNNIQMNGGMPPEMPNGQFNNSNFQPPEIPNNSTENN